MLCSAVAFVEGYDPNVKEFTGQSFVTEITFITDYQQKD